MNRPKKEMKAARKSFKHEKRENKQKYRLKQSQHQHVFKERRKEAAVLFSSRPGQFKAVQRELLMKHKNDRQLFKKNFDEQQEVTTSRYTSKVRESPYHALTAKEIKLYRLPELQDNNREARSRFLEAKKSVKESRNTYRQKAFSYRQKERESTNFGRRQSNFTTYRSKSDTATVYVRTGVKNRFYNLFTKEQQSRIVLQRKGQFVSHSSDKDTSTSNRFFYKGKENANRPMERGRIHFKRLISGEKHIKQTESGRFWYENPDLKEKKSEQTKANMDYKAAKENLKQAKRVYRYKRPRTKLLHVGRFVGREIADVVATDDDLSSIRDLQHATRNTVKYSKFGYQSAKTVAKGSVHLTKAGVNTTKGTYRFGKQRVVNFQERVRNYKTGRGFRLNNPDRQLKNRMKQYASRMRQGVVASFKKKIELLKSIPQVVMNFLTNPATLWGVGIGLIFLLMIVFFMDASSRMLIQQDEFELDKAYLHMTKVDAEESIKADDGTTYYTKIDDVMAYMNYRFQDYELDDRIHPALAAGSDFPRLSFSATTYQTYLTTLWSDLNGGESLKSMADLYQEEGKYHLSKESIEEFDEYKEEGIYAALTELENPFQGQTEEDSLSMLYRYGYYNVDGNAEKSDYIILDAKQGQVIVAPMDGIAKVEGEDILIVSQEGKITEARLRLNGIVSGRVKNGQKIYTGDIIGQLQSDHGLQVYYQKYKDKKEKLVYVNPAFYFPNVTQVQTTILPSIGQFQGDEVERAKIVYEYLKSKGASNQFIAAVLGNWSIESNIRAKSAEGDYLSPPVGATETSWDDPAWLNMNGPMIYNGRFPNIIHRGLGLGQWTDTADGSVRQTMLREYAQRKGKKWYDIELQLDFMMHGDSPYYTNWVLSHMKDTGSPASLAQLFLIYWEGNPGDKLVDRQQRAIEWFYQIEKGFHVGAAGTAKVDPKTLGQIKNDLFDGVVPGGGNDMGYPWGQCTWGAAKRINQLGLTLKGRDGSKIPIISTMGNGMQWVSTAAQLGGETGSTPRNGAIVSFNLGDPYGHVAIVEKVYPDGSFLISETNYNGSAYNPTGVVTFRTISGVDASMSFAYTQK